MSACHELFSWKIDSILCEILVQKAHKIFSRIDIICSHTNDDTAFDYLLPSTTAIVNVLYFSYCTLILQVVY